MASTDLRKEFVEDLSSRAIQCSVQCEGRYLLGTSLARPVIARARMKVTHEEQPSVGFLDGKRLREPNFRPIY